jgi:hypothetical protein
VCSRALFAISDFGFAGCCYVRQSRLPAKHPELFLKQEAKEEGTRPCRLQELFALHSLQMADRAAIEAPFTLASLPKPFDSTVGTTFAAPVFGLRGQKWRKRPEIVASVDGDSITIYNVTTALHTGLRPGIVLTRISRCVIRAW